MTTFQKLILVILGTVVLCVMVNLTLAVGWYIITSSTKPMAITQSIPAATATPGLRATAMPTLRQTAAPKASVSSPSHTPTAMPLTALDAPIIPLGFRVIDAEYSPALDRIIMVSENPNQLHIYDPAAQADSIVDLSYSPTSVSVGPDGLFAAVGHDSKISYVDLRNKQVVKTLDVTIPVSDIVLAGNGWIYAGSSKQEGLKAIEIATNNEASGGQHFYDGSMYKLHPEGKALYWANNGVSPDDIGKTDISQGTPGQSYDSPYHGDHSMCGNLWLSADGQRIFTACGNVFRASSDRQRDMTYNGSLAGVRSIRSLVYAASAGQILVLAGVSPNHYDDNPPQDQLLFFNYETLQKSEVFGLPSFEVNNISYPAHGRFVFVNTAGTQYYVVAQADQASGLLNDYGLVVHDLDLSKQAAATPTGQVATTATPSFGGPIIPLKAAVVDAEYSLSLDRIIMVSDNPPQLHIYDPAAQSDVTVALSYAPTSVSVGPDGKFAAVGHDAKISYVDLQSGQVAKVLDVSTDVFDVVLAGNGWVYASPRRDQWETLRAVEIATNNEAQSQGNQIYAGSVYKLHPDGRSVYGANRGLSPSDIEKIDISQGIPKYAYDSPYHGDYGMCGNLWMSEDGQRIFTACGNVFRASSDRKTDMTYNGSLSRLPYIQHVVHSVAAGRVLAIPAAQAYGQSEGALAENQLAIFGYDTLNTEKIVPLPDFVVNGKPLAAHGRFVFVNSAGTQYYVIVQADEASGLLNDFGLVVNGF